MFLTESNLSIFVT